MYTLNTLHPPPPPKKPNVVSPLQKHLSIKAEQHWTVKGGGEGGRYSKTTETHRLI